MSRQKRFVGFGFGPIQIGLMLLEASESGSFGDFAVSEIDGGLVEAVRAHAGSVTVNVAGLEGIRRKVINGIGIFNPRTGRKWRQPCATRTRWPRPFRMSALTARAGHHPSPR